ncbi:MAG: Rab family GTPase [Candidatus Kariarchaeaceae archaeon]
MILVGSLGVGKTSLVNKITTDKEFNEPLTTIYTHSLFMGGSQVELNIWDTLGQEKSGKIPPSFYREAQGAIIVYDVTDDRSYIEVDHWIQSVKFLAGDIPLIIVGNKCEIYRRKILTGRASDKAIHYEASYVETSVKQEIKITELFNEMARRCLNAPPDDLEIPKEGVEEMTPVIEELTGTITDRQPEEIAELTPVEEISEMSITSVVPFSESNSVETPSQELQIPVKHSIHETRPVPESTLPDLIETEITSQDPSDFASDEPVDFASDEPSDFASDEPVDFASDEPVDFASDEPVSQTTDFSELTISTETPEIVTEEPISDEIETKDIFEDLPNKSEHWAQIQQKIESVSSSFTDESDDTDTIPKVRPSIKKTGFATQDELTQRILKKVSTIKQIEKSDKVITPNREIPRIIPIEKFETSSEKSSVSLDSSETQVKQPYSPASNTVDDPLIPRDGEIIDIDILDEPESSISEQSASTSVTKTTSDPYIKPDPTTPSVIPSSEMSFSNYKDEKASLLIKNLKTGHELDESINKVSPSSVIGGLDSVNKPRPTSTPSVKPLDPSAETIEEESSTDQKDTKNKKSFIPKP